MKQTFKIEIIIYVFFKFHLLGKNKVSNINIYFLTLAYLIKNCNK